MLAPYEHFLSPFEKVLIDIQERVPESQFKTFVWELTGDCNIPTLAKKYNFDIHDLAIAARFTVQLCHYLIETELIAEKQKSQPVRMWSAA